MYKEFKMFLESSDYLNTIPPYLWFDDFGNIKYDKHTINYNISDNYYLNLNIIYKTGIEDDTLSECSNQSTEALKVLIQPLEPVGEDKKK